MLNNIYDNKSHLIQKKINLIFLAKKNISHKRR